MDNPKEIFEFIQGNAKKYLCVDMFVKIIDTGKDTESQCLRITEIEDYYITFGQHCDEDQLFDDVKSNIEWEELEGTLVRPGWYQLNCLFSIGTDYDDYRSWHWYEVEHAEFTYAISLEQREKEQKNFEDIIKDTTDNLFGFL